MEAPPPRTLRLKKRFIHQNLKPESVTRILHKNGVFEHNEALKITSEELKADQISQFIESMEAKNSREMEELLKALQRTRQGKVHRALVREQRVLRLLQQSADVAIPRTPCENRINADLLQVSLSRRPNSANVNAVRKRALYKRPATAGVRETPDVHQTPSPAGANYKSTGKTSSGLITLQSDGQDSDEPYYELQFMSQEYGRLKEITRGSYKLKDSDIYRNRKSCLLVFGHSKMQGGDVEIIAVRPDSSIRRLGILAKGESASHSGIAVSQLHDCVYISSLGSRKNQVWSFDLDTGDQKMAGYLRLDGRYDHCMVTVGHLIYILGGVANDSLSSEIEAFDPLSKSSIKVGDIVSPARNAAATTWKNSIFLFGGYKERLFHVDLVQQFDITTKQCTLLRPLASIAAFLRPYQWGRYTFLFGSHHCFVYDTETQFCSRRASYHTNLNQFGLLPVKIQKDTEFVVFGGRDSYKNHSRDVVTASLSEIAMDRRTGWVPQQPLEDFVIFTNAQIPTSVSSLMLK